LELKRETILDSAKIDFGGHRLNVRGALSASLNDSSGDAARGSIFVRLIPLGELPEKTLAIPVTIQRKSLQAYPDRINIQSELAAVKKTVLIVSNFDCELTVEAIGECKVEKTTRETNIDRTQFTVEVQILEGSGELRFCCGKTLLNVPVSLIVKDKQ